MNHLLFDQKDTLPPLILSKLAAFDLDYAEKHREIIKTHSKETPQREAGVVLLLHYKTSGGNAEYVFQLIKRSAKVAQAGDISCPGGILDPTIDKFLVFLLRSGIIPIINAKNKLSENYQDKETSRLAQLFLVNALREAWEEIGLSPFNVDFLGALPSYTLTSFPRTIFPVVCLTRKEFQYRPSEEVEKVLEVPLRYFWESSNYAWLQLTSTAGGSAYNEGGKFPCLVIKNDAGDDEILWGATLYVISSFFAIIFGRNLPFTAAVKNVKKEITESYLAGGRLR